MNIENKLIRRLERLVELGEEVLDKKTGNDVDSEIAIQWYVSTENFLTRVFGENSIYVEKVKLYIYPTEDEYKEYYTFNYWGTQKALGVLKAILDDLEFDGIYNLKTMIQAEMFDDFLSQAEYLIQSGYFQPAAVIIGCVLEDGLRKLCLKYNITLPDRPPKLDWMNGQLAKHGVYGKQTQKFITAYADLRNQAAHGKWDELAQKDVKRFLNWTGEFMERNFPKKDHL